MLNLKKLAITGEIASGKSSLGKIFEDHGAYLLDADKIVHSLLKTPHVQDQVLQILGPQIKTDGNLDKKKIAEIVFNDTSKLYQLEKILHPLVEEEVKEKYQAVCHKPNWKLFVVEMPLLFEMNSSFDYDYTIAVLADQPVRKKRFEQRQKTTVKDFSKRDARHFKASEKEKKANFVIYNNGSFEDLKNSFLKIYPKIFQ